jgi:hypothetical protein
VTISGDTASAILIGVVTLLGWLVTQAQARNRATRAEVKWRRSVDLIKDRYIYRLERCLASKDIPLPEHPEGWEVVVKDEQGW